MQWQHGRAPRPADPKVKGGTHTTDEADLTLSLGHETTNKPLRAYHHHSHHGSRGISHVIVNVHEHEHDACVHKYIRNICVSNFYVCTVYILLS